MKQLGYKLHGTGKEKVILLHNWFSDASSYEPMLPYLDLEKFTYLFADVRGYGRSKEMKGNYTLQEVSGDVISLIGSLSWERFSVVGHSMSGMIAQKIAVDAKERVKSVVAITPVPATGSPSPPEVAGFLESAARDNDDFAKECIHLLTGRRWSSNVMKKLIEHWRLCSIPEARVGYLNMYSNTDFSKEAQGLKTPILMIYAQYDFEGSEKALKEVFQRLYPKLKIALCEGSGHFPTQETPLYLASLIENFIFEHCK